MTSIASMRDTLLTRLLDGDGVAPRAMRRAAFHNAVEAEPLRTVLEKVAREAWKITDEDIAAARRSGLSEDEIFELVVCAAVGQANRLYEIGMEAVDRACEESTHATGHSR